MDRARRLIITLTVAAIVLTSVAALVTPISAGAGNASATAVTTSSAAHTTKASTGLVFSDGFESGWDVWTYDSPHRDGQLGRHATSGPGAVLGATYALESTVVHSGNTAAKFTLPATRGAWSNVYKTVPYSTTLYMSGWFKFDATIPNGSYLMVGPCICAYDDHDLVDAYIRNVNGVYKWTMEYYTNAASDRILVTSDLGPSIQPNVWYNVQVMTKVGVGNGEATMWVMKQGQSQFTQIYHVSGLTNDGDKGPNGEVGARHLQVGPYIPASWLVPSPPQQAYPATVWYDDTVASTEFIAPPIASKTPTTFGLSAASQSVKPNAMVRLTGTLRTGAAGLSGQPVELWIKSGTGAWYKAATRQTGAGGVINWDVWSTGHVSQTYQYYFLFPGTSTHAAAKSNVVTIRFENTRTTPYQTALNAYAPKPVIAHGTKNTMYVKLTSGATPLTGQYVYVWKYSGGKFVIVSRTITRTAAQSPGAGWAQADYRWNSVGTGLYKFCYYGTSPSGLTPYARSESNAVQLIWT